MDEKELINTAKNVKALETHEDMEGAILLVNGLAKCDSKEANKQFERLTGLLALPLQPA